MKEFDAENCPLEGKILVEASAGTGKTYNIQLLVLRLLLEKEIPLEKILVVTFTVFATDELKTRLHKILLLTSQAFDLCSRNQKEIEKAEFNQIRKIVEKEFIKKDQVRRKECIKLINTALRDFDQAAVMTIHGFCNRMLLDHAFDSKISFGIELKKDIGEIQQRIAMDFIRIIRCSNQDLGQKLDPELTESTLWKKLELAVNNSENQAKICWDNLSEESWQKQLEDLNKDAQDWNDSFTNRLGPCFLAFYREQMEKLKARENFLTFDDLIRRMAEIVTDEVNGAALRKAIRRDFQYVFVDEFQDTDPLQYKIFSRIFGGNDSGQGDGKSGFFMIGDPKQAIYSFRGGDINAYLKAREEVPLEHRYSLSSNYRSGKNYIDALNKFFQVFTQKLKESKEYKGKVEFEVPEIKFGGKEKANLYCGNDPVEHLIQLDNVGKTDAINNATVQKVLELISPQKYYLSDSAEKKKPVSASDIAILFPSKRKGRKIESLLNRAGIDTIWMSDSDIFIKPEAKALYELLKMLYDGCSFPQVLEVLAGDIFQFTATELCRLQRKGNFTEDELKRFEGKAEEAQMYFLDLRKIWEKQGIYAMFSKLMFTPNEEDRSWLSAIRDKVTGRFENDGTLAQHLIFTDFVEGRYTLGRLRQLCDLLHQAEQDRQLTPGRLLDYLLRKINQNHADDSDDADTAALIHRSTDLDAVRLITLHSSKGLEFPIVLIPFLITGKLPPQRTPRLFHNDQDVRCIDMTNWYCVKNQCQCYKESCEKEYLHERVRLFYVGLTRAKFFCYLPYPSSNKGTDRCANLKPYLPNPSEFPVQNFKVENHVSQLVKGFDASSVVRKFNGKIIMDWNLASFSKFNQGSHRSSPKDVYGGTDEETASQDYDHTQPETSRNDLKSPLPGDDAQGSIFKFGTGEEMGTVWHEIFEKMNFDPPGLSPDGLFDEKECNDILKAIDNPSLYKYIRRRREDDEESAKRDLAFARMLKGILYNPMGQLSESGVERFQLRNIPVSRRASELKFMFVLKENHTLKEIKDCLERHGISTGTWAESAEAGYRDWTMIGFIDLLIRSDSGKYYIIDWKSNRLNSEAELADFDQNGMQSEIDKCRYSLQFLIYTVALWHFLKARQNLDLTEENYTQYFGGILYLFVRGIAAPLPAMTEEEKEVCRKRGIYYRLPPFKLISELKNLLDIRPLVRTTVETEKNR